MECDIGRLIREAAKSLLDPTILPYYVLNIIYGISQTINAEDELSQVLTVAFKTAPIWYLVFHTMVIKRNRLAVEHELLSTDSIGDEDEIRYNTYFTRGLIMSIAGDALLVFPSTFLHGVFFFAAAHIFYIMGLRMRYGKAGFAWLAVPICLITSPYIMIGIESYPIGAVIFSYNVTINTLLFYAISGLESQCSTRTFLAAVGASFFVLSDFILAFDIWITKVPYRGCIVMTAYYFAQVNLALSVC